MQYCNLRDRAACCAELCCIISQRSFNAVQVSSVLCIFNMLLNEVMGIWDKNGVNVCMTCNIDVKLQHLKYQVMYIPRSVI